MSSLFWLIDWAQGNKTRSCVLIFFSSIDRSSTFSFFLLFSWKRTMKEKEYRRSDQKKEEEQPIVITSLGSSPDFSSLFEWSSDQLLGLKPRSLSWSFIKKEKMSEGKSPAGIHLRAHLSTHLFFLLIECVLVCSKNAGDVIWNRVESFLCRFSFSFNSRSHSFHSLRLLEKKMKRNGENFPDPRFQDQN